MEPPRVLWAAPTARRPGSVDQWTLREAGSEAEALETVRRMAGTGVELDAVVAAPDLPNGDGASVLRAVRDRWSDAACFLHGDLWAIPEGSELPVCEFHPESQTVADVVAAVSDAVRRRYHRPYPVFEDEPRRLEVVEAIVPEAARPDVDAIVTETADAVGADLSLLSVVADRTVHVVAASDDRERRPIHRGDSPCAYAVCESGTTVIDDLRADERLDHTETGCPGQYRSYAGHPVWVDGAPVGVLCAFDGTPGSLVADELGELPAYAQRAERALEATL